MARTGSRERLPRPALALNPTPGLTLGAVAIGLVLLWLAWLGGRQDGWAALVWAFPGVYVVAQPVRGLVRGQDKKLTVGLHSIDLSGLRKVTVYERKTLGIRHAVAVLMLNHRVEEISGLFLSTASFTRLVEWLGGMVEVLDGLRTPRQLLAERPDLTPTRPAMTKQQR